MNHGDNIPARIFGKDGITVYSIIRSKGNKYKIVPLQVQPFYPVSIYSGNETWYTSPQTTPVVNQSVGGMVQNYAAKPTVVYTTTVVPTTPNNADQPAGSKKKKQNRKKATKKVAAKVTDQKVAEPVANLKPVGPVAEQVVDKNVAEPEGPVAESD